MTTEYAWTITDNKLPQNCAIDKPTGALETWSPTMPEGFQRSESEDDGSFPDGEGEPAVDYTIVDDGRPYVTMLAGDVSANILCTDARFLVGGSVKDLHGTIVLVNGDVETTLTSESKEDQPFSYDYDEPGAYDVSIKTQPDHQTCTISNNSGTAEANVTNVEVVCTYKAYAIGGSVPGQTGALTLAVGDVTLEVGASDTSYSFPDLQALGDHTVTVATQPAGQTCSVNASGAQESLTGDVTDADVVCAVDAHAIGGTVSGVVGSVTLQLNGGQDKVVSDSDDGSFTFDTELADGTGYAVTVSSQPSNQTCTVSGGTGTANAAVSDVSVSCTDNEYSVSITVSGIIGGPTAGPLGVRNNAADTLSMYDNGTYTFTHTVKREDAWNYFLVTLVQPTGHSCVISPDGGVISDDITVSATCTPATPTFTVGGTADGLDIAVPVTLRLTYGPTNTTEDLNVAGNVMPGVVGFDFAAALDDGDAYAVTIHTQPMGGLTCSVDSGGSGTISSADVTDVVITCL